MMHIDKLKRDVPAGGSFALSSSVPVSVHEERRDASNSKRVLGMGPNDRTQILGS